MHRFLDGELGPAASRRVETHLAACSGCRTAFAELVRLEDLLNGISPADVPQTFAARVLTNTAIDPALPSHARARWVSAIAAACAIVAIGWAGFRIGEAYGAQAHQDVIQSALSSPIEPDF